jgi:MerR family copper efflux transcriptional regulator
MKPLGFSIEEMHELLTLLADLTRSPGDPELVDRLRMFHQAATARVHALREQLTVTEGFAGTLADRLDSASAERSGWRPATTG